MTSRAAWAAVAAAILLRGAWIAAATFSPLPIDDVDGFLSMAERLIAGQPLVTALRDDVGVIRPPLYPWMLSIALRAGLPMIWILVAQIGLAVWTVVAVRWLGTLIGGTRAGTIAAWIAACWPAWFSSAATVATEHLDVPAVTTSLALLVAAVQRRDSLRAGAAGLSFGAAALVRSASLYLAPLLALLSARRLRFRAALAIAGVAIVAVPYIVAISRQAGRVVMIENLLEWNWRLEQQGRVTLETGNAAFSGLPAAIADEYRRDPLGHARRAAGRMKMMLLSTRSWEYSTDQQVPAWIARGVHTAAGVSAVLLYLCAIVGAVRMRSREGTALLLAWTALHLSAAMIGPGIEARHRAPFEPALMALAAAAFART